MTPITENSTPIASDEANPMHTMEVCGSVLTYEPHAHTRECLTWSGPYRGLPDRMLRVTHHYHALSGLITWDARVYEPAHSKPIAEAIRINGTPEGVVRELEQRMMTTASLALHFLIDLDLEDDSEDGPRALTAAVKAYRDVWNAQFGESRAAGTLGRFYPETDPRVTQ